MEYLKVWTSFRELLEPLTDEEKGRLFIAMLDYAETGLEPKFSGCERYVWPAARQSINNTRDRSEQMKANGSKPKQKETKESNPEQAEAEPSRLFDKEKENNKENIKENPIKGVKEKRDRFSPPTVDEVAAYCKERGNKIDPQRFVDFYAAKGWKVGNQPMKDWRACVRTWEQRDNNTASPQRPRLLRAQDYKQREYNGKQLESVLGVDDIYAEGAS